MRVTADLKVKHYGRRAIFGIRDYCTNCRCTYDQKLQAVTKIDVGLVLPFASRFFTLYKADNFDCSYRGQLMNHYLHSLTTLRQCENANLLSVAIIKLQLAADERRLSFVQTSGKVAVTARTLIVWRQNKAFQFAPSLSPACLHATYE